MFKIYEELKVISVDLPTTGCHAILLEESKDEDGNTILVLRVGGLKKQKEERPVCCS